MDNAMKNLMFDAAQKKTIYDAETERTISPDEVNDTIRAFCLEKLGLNEKSTARDITRALKRDSALELFEIIEEIVDVGVSTGWRQDEMFDQYVEGVNLKDGDENSFLVENDVILTVTKVAGDHHDLIMQKLGIGQVTSIPTSVFAIKVGTDIRLFLTGRKKWSDFIDATVKAFINTIKQEIYTAVMGVGTALGSQFAKSSPLSSATKDTFDTLIEDVSAANNGAEVVIFGTKTALKKINALTDVDWRSYSQKEDVAAHGILGHYEGTTLIEIPQRFAANDLATKLIATDKLLIMPLVDDKFVKFVDYGETTLEVTEIGATMNDQQMYEVQRRMGVGTIISRKFGLWTITSGT